jgi:putative Ca2+/H+ antiporter (TMEM165/GDT1 family)
MLRLVDVGTTATTIAEAPDFSVPDTSSTFAARDPSDSGRAIRPGEVSLLTPIFARNKGTATAVLTVEFLSEAGDRSSFAVVSVPAGETAAIPVQGQSLVKRVLAGTNGDRLQVKSGTADVFDIHGAADERVSSEHIGVVT